MHSNWYSSVSTIRLDHTYVELFKFTLMGNAVNFDAFLSNFTPKDANMPSATTTTTTMSSQTISRKFHRKKKSRRYRQSR